MKKRVAVFDIDGTILRGASTERMFFWHLVFTGELGFRELGYFLSPFFRYFFTDNVTATKGNKWYFKGKDCARIKSIGLDFFRDSIKRNISNIAMDMMEKHRQDGVEVMLLSGAFDFFMDEYLKYLKIEKGYSTKLEEKDGKFTGFVEGLFPYGINKAKILEAEAENIDFEHSFAYGNDSSDIPFLKMFGNAVAVNPDGKLLKYARENNLKVLYS